MSQFKVTADHRIPYSIDSHQQFWVAINPRDMLVVLPPYGKPVDTSEAYGNHHSLFLPLNLSAMGLEAGILPLHFHHSRYTGHLSVDSGSR
jgi:hypothetical protein